jgi:hypothetical protein
LLLIIRHLNFQGIKMFESNKNLMVTGLFNDRASAEAAYETLAERGYAKDDVNLVMSDAARERHFSGAHNQETELGNQAAKGAGIGGAIGGTLGAVIAAIAAVGTSIAIPGAGLIIAGPIVAALAGAGAGGATGGLLGALIGWGIPEERVAHYDEGIRNGGILMGVVPRSEEDALHIENKWKEHNGQHVIGTGLGASAGALTGAAIGSVVGPVGTVIGGAIGAVTGGLAGKGAAEVVNPDSGDTLSEHNLSKGTGASAGAVAGAAVGAVGGPIGMAAGAAIGAIAGGLAGKGAGEVANPHATDQLGYHNLAKGTGATGGAIAGATIGALGGPLGMAAGAAIGAVAGGAAMHGAATVVNPAVEDAHWRDAYTREPYVNHAFTYDDYAPAYRLGYTNRAKSTGSFEASEVQLSQDWQAIKGTSRLTWDEARNASKAAWHRVG